MCGIVGAVAHRNVVPLLIEGLRRLEYRGYDSCGVAVIDGDEVRRIRGVARVADLYARICCRALIGATGLAHLRQATHGAPALRNAHPISSFDTIVLVHDGVIENHESLRNALMAKGYWFASETDTEVIAHLVHSCYRGDLREAVSQAVQSLRGAYAIAVFSREEPHRMVGAQCGARLVVGLGEKANFLSSDALAFCGNAECCAFLQDGDVADLQGNAVHIFDAAGRAVALRRCAALEGSV